eukprot:scaffold58967_cov35-Prasinocladus_malaysianus.AAC.2
MDVAFHTSSLLVGMEASDSPTSKTLLAASVKKLLHLMYFLTVGIIINRLIRQGAAERLN